MAKYLTSKIIKSTRMALGMTREELAEGICSAETLYHCESGQHEITQEIYEQLMRKMGRIGEKNYTFLSVGGMEALELQEKLIAELGARNMEKANLLLRELERVMPEEKWDISDKQFFITCHSRIDMGMGKITPEKCLEQLKEALNLTIKDINKIDLEYWVFNYQERMILLNIMEVYRRIGLDEKFEKLIVNMIKGIKNAKMPGWKEEYVFFTECYLKLIDENAEKGKEVLKISEEILTICKEEQISRIIPDIYDSILCSRKTLEEQGERNIELEIQALKRSYYLTIAAEGYVDKTLENIWKKQYNEKDFISV